MRRGTGLIAGSPGSIGSPALVTVPTPSPALNWTPLREGRARTLETMSARCVTSGSSPASLTMPALAQFLPRLRRASAKLGRSPFGSRISTGSGNSPVRSAVKAALVAAVAQAPVVQPRRNGPSGLRVMALF